MILIESLVFSATSSKDDIHRRIGGRCSTHNMKVVFKVCCRPEDQQNNNQSKCIRSTTLLNRDGRLQLCGARVPFRSDSPYLLKCDVPTLKNKNHHVSYTFPCISITSFAKR